MKRKSILPGKYGGFAQYSELPKKYMDVKAIKVNNPQQSNTYAATQMSQLEQIINSGIARSQKVGIHEHKKDEELKQVVKKDIMTKMMKDFNAEISLSQDNLRQKFYQQLSYCMVHIEGMQDPKRKDYLIDQVFGWQKNFINTNEKHFQNEYNSKFEEQVTAPCTTTHTQENTKTSWFNKIGKQTQFFDNDNILFDITNEPEPDEHIFDHMEKIWKLNQKDYQKMRLENQEQYTYMRNFLNQKSKQNQRKQVKIQGKQFDQDLNVFQESDGFEQIYAYTQRHAQTGQLKRESVDDNQQKKQLIIKNCLRSLRFNPTQREKKEKKKIQDNVDLFKQMKINKAKQNLYQQTQKNFNIVQQETANLNQQLDLKKKTERPKSQQYRIIESQELQDFNISQSIKQKLSIYNIYQSQNTIQNAVCQPRSLSPGKQVPLKQPGSTLLYNPFFTEKRKIKRKRKLITTKK